MSRESGTHADTWCVHGGSPPDGNSGAIVPPLFQSTTYAWASLDKPPAITYARAGNPTVSVLERRIAGLEEGGDAVCFGSGLAAIDALLRCLSRPARIVVGRQQYGGTTRLLRELYSHVVQVDWVDSSDESALRLALETPADLLFVETPSNPTLQITDLRVASQLAHEAGALFAVDNTLLTPLYQKPLELGADVTVHSTTKYLDGHDATLGGAVVIHPRHCAGPATGGRSLPDRLRWVRKSTGSVLAPFEAWLTLQGTKTLHLRTRAQWATAARLASQLARHKAVHRTYYPGLADHPGHDIHRSQSTGDGGVIGVDLGSFVAARSFTSSLRLFSIAENLGPTESIVTHPASMTHADLSIERRSADGITPGLVRLSIGVEDPDDIAADLSHALDSLSKAEMLLV